MNRSRLIASGATAAALVAVSLLSFAQTSGPLFVLKDESGRIRADSVANLEALRNLSDAPSGVRLWVTFEAQFDPDLLPETEEFRIQARRIERVRERLISELEVSAPASNEYDAPSIGPYFAVVTDRAGVDFLASEKKVTRIFGPA